VNFIYLQMKDNILKPLFSKKKIEIILSAVALTAIVILSSIFVKYYIIGLFIGIILLFHISSKLSLFKDFEVKDTVTKYNSNLEKAIQEISLLLNMTHSTVLISSGSLNEEIWGNSEIISILKSLVEKNKSINIITCEILNVKKHGRLYDFLKENIEKGTINFFSREEPPDAHFLVIDDSSVRLEEIHAPNKIIERKAIIKLHRFSLAGRARNKFERLRVGAKMVTKQNFETLTFNK